MERDALKNEAWSYNASEARSRAVGETFMEHPIRVGAVNYLNTKPLICDLEQLAPQAELILDVPSRLADLLAEGQLDVALIPVLSYFQAGCYSVVPNIAIASR